MNILNIKQLLAFAFLFGVANCKSLADYKKEIEDALESKQTIIVDATLEQIEKALKHPKLFVDNGYDFEKMKDIKADVYAKDEPYKFYRLDDSIKIEDLKEAIKVNDVSKIGSELKKTLDEDAKKKRMFLHKILNRISIFQNRGHTDKDDAALNSQIRKFIYEATAFDAGRLSYSNLHKAVDSLKGAFEVERKARDAANAVIVALDDAIEKKSTIEAEKIEDKDYFSFHFTLNKEQKAEKAKEMKEKGIKEAVNFISIGLKASDRSTSSAAILGYTFAISIVISVGALVFKGFFSKSSKPEELEEEQ